jgi:SAM-dependent methyltransferase
VTNGRADYGDAFYNEAFAAVYDDWFPEERDDVVDALVELAGRGPALELGIGSGRVAIPLAKRGVRVHGIDNSGAMVERLRAKPGASSIDVTVGDFADTDLGTRFPLVYVVGNTLYCLPDQDAQVRCFAGAARHLRRRGVFVVECFVPDMTWWSHDQAVQVLEVAPDRVVLEATKHNSVAQVIDGSYISLTNGDVRLFPVRLRYAWPAELDLMAALAGLRLRERWADWDGSPFDAASGHHVSIYEIDPS